MLAEYLDEDDAEALQKMYMATAKIDSANRFNAIIRSEFTCYLIDDATTTEPFNYYDLIVERS